MANNKTKLLKNCIPFRTKIYEIQSQKAQLIAPIYNPNRHPDGLKDDIKIREII